MHTSQGQHTQRGGGAQQTHWLKPTTASTTSARAVVHVHMLNTHNRLAHAWHPPGKNQVACPPAAASCTSVK